jgi:hypothetical protein
MFPYFSAHGLFLAFAVVCVVPNAAATANDRPTGKNCDLRIPPKNSGEDEDHAILMKVYPRISAMARNYTGCQAVWFRNTKAWEIISVTVLRNGDPVRIWAPSPADAVRYSCRYQHGKVISGDAKNCVAPEVLLQGSVPAGCMTKIAASAGSKASPAGCMPDGI